MSELYFYLGPKPIRQPIETRGNWFWKGNERFLIKGINYFTREGQNGAKPTVRDPRVDVLADEHLDQLRQDIHLFQELRVNAISVSSLDSTKNHDKAMKLLAEAGIYVLVLIGEDIRTRTYSPAEEVDQHFDTQPYYTTDMARRTFRLVDQLADWPNLLGFQVSGETMNWLTTTKIAEVVRAMIRDVKIFLRLRGGGAPPVGAHISGSVMLNEPALRYFTAGTRDDESRADFFCLEAWGWMIKSSFQISGWKNQLVERLGSVPVPMFLSAYGTADYKRARPWEEVECLYSPDMTGVFSGGCTYTLYEYGNNFGIVATDGEGVLRRKGEFETLKKKLRNVARRDQDQVWVEEVKDYESWEGEFPEIKEGRWCATGHLPVFPLDWNEFMRDLNRYEENSQDQ